MGCTSSVHVEPPQQSGLKSKPANDALPSIKSAKQLSVDKTYDAFEISFTNNEFAKLNSNIEDLLSVPIRRGSQLDPITRPSKSGEASNSFWQNHQSQASSGRLARIASGKRSRNSVVNLSEEPFKHNKDRVNIEDEPESRALVLKNKLEQADRARDRRLSLIQAKQRERHERAQQTREKATLLKQMQLNTDECNLPSDKESESGASSQQSSGYNTREVSAGSNATLSKINPLVRRLSSTKGGQDADRKDAGASLPPVDSKRPPPHRVRAAAGNRSGDASDEDDHDDFKSYNRRQNPRRQTDILSSMDEDFFD